MNMREPSGSGAPANRHTRHRLQRVEHARLLGREPHERLALLLDVAPERPNEPHARSDGLAEGRQVLVELANALEGHASEGEANRPRQSECGTRDDADGGAGGLHPR